MKKMGKVDVVNIRNLRHGLRTQALLPWEDSAEHDALVAQVADYLKPASPAEAEIVHSLAGIMWRLRRVGVAELALFSKARRATVEPMLRAAGVGYHPCQSMPPHSPVSEVAAEGAALLAGLSSDKLVLIGRYEASLQRAARRQLFLLSAMRRLRGGQLIDHENMEGGERQTED